LGIDEFLYSSISDGVSEKKAFSEPETKAETIRSKKISSIPIKIPNVKDLTITLVITSVIVKLDVICITSNANIIISDVYKNR
jgi:hypothetical protein